MFRTRLITLAAVAGASLAATASLAGAQAIDSHDGGPPQAGQPNVVTHTCGALTTNPVKTNNVPDTTNFTNFQQLPGASTTINVPGGQQRCVKVLFTAETACGLSAAADYCYIEATIDGVPMDPQGNGFQAMDSEDPTASAHAYEWVDHVGPGNHLVQIQRRVGAPTTDFYTDDWTFDVEVHL
jgi:hypothetical protein